MYLPTAQSHIIITGIGTNLTMCLGTSVIRHGTAKCVWGVTVVDNWISIVSLSSSYVSNAIQLPLQNRVRQWERKGIGR